MYNNLMCTFYEDSRRLSKRSLNIHMSQVNFDKQYHAANIYYVVSYIIQCQKIIVYIIPRGRETGLLEAHSI